MSTKLLTGQSDVEVSRTDYPPLLYKVNGHITSESEAKDGLKNTLENYTSYVAKFPNFTGNIRAAHNRVKEARKMVVAVLDAANNG